MYVARVLFNDDAQQISFHSAEMLPRKLHQNMTFALKKSIMEKNAFEVLLNLHRLFQTMQASHKRHILYTGYIYIYEWINFGSISYIACGKFEHFSTMKCQQRI